jgi:NAD(P)-dependent dehydrogenase (short-subunit alcohol dehydrogenase family)
MAIDAPAIHFFVTSMDKPARMLQCSNLSGADMEIAGKVAVITGAASGIGRAVAAELARRNERAMALVDMGENIDDVAVDVNAQAGRHVAHPFQGDATDETFRASVFDSISSQFDTVTMCVPAAGITRDDLAVRIDKMTGKARIYPIERFKQVIDVNLVAPCTGRSR